jgi:hypothetical protein
MARRLVVDYQFVVAVAREVGCVDWAWRESAVSFTGFVAEVWFDAVPQAFAVKWARVVGYAVHVRVRSDGPGRYAVSVPCRVPLGEVRLGYVCRGSRVRLVRE